MRVAEAPAGTAGARALSRAEFELFQKLIRDVTGIHMSDGKIALIEGRLSRRLKELSIRRYLDYYRLVTVDLAERQQMLDRITTHETRFFREPWPFTRLGTSVLPAWRAHPPDRGHKVIRAWSAGCSTGEESYSMAMELLEHFPVAAGWRVEVLATDIAQESLDRAARGVYALGRTERIPEALLRKYMLRGTGNQHGKAKVSPELSAVVQFSRLNLYEAGWSTEIGTFDLVLCRNVLIYFDAASRRETVGRLLDVLKPHGLLIVGHAESLAGVEPRARFVAPTIYGLAADPVRRTGR